MDRAANVALMTECKKIRAVLIVVKKIITFVAHPSSEDSYPPPKSRKRPPSVEKPIYNCFCENGIQRWPRDTAEIV